jgi:ATP sulfurylase
MKELIHTIVEVIRKNATVDWSKRDDVRAKLRLTVKKILMRYGYPPDNLFLQCIYLANNTRSKRGRYPFLFISKEIRGNK